MNVLNLTPEARARVEAFDGDWVVTGATGWLGLACLHALHEAIGNRVETQVRAFASRATEVTLINGRRFPVQPLSELTGRGRSTAMLHFAFPTQDKVAAWGIARYVEAVLELRAQVLRAWPTLQLRGIFIPSSGAVYSHSGSTSMQTYGAFKLWDENTFEQLSRTDGVQCIVARVFNVAGPYMNKVDSYALSSILSQLRSGGRVTLRATKRVERSFAHVGDIVSGALSALANNAGSLFTRFDTVGEQVVEVGDLAKACASVVGQREVVIDRPVMTSETDRYVGSGAGYSQWLAAHGVLPRLLETQIRDTDQFFTQVQRMEMAPTTS